jgi:hypothetical protein
MRALAITTESAVIPASVCAAIRHPLVADLAKCRRDHVPVAPEIVDAVEMIDNVGAWWENRHVAVDVATVDAPRCDPAQWTTVTETAALLDISQQAVKGLLLRGTIHGEKVDRAWRVCAQSVSARLEGAKCQH